MTARNRLRIGKAEYVHRGRLIPTVVGSVEWDQFIIDMQKGGIKTRVGFVPPGYEHRPDLISNLFYGTPAYYWLIMWVNNIADPFEDLNINDRILIPVI